VVRDQGRKGYAAVAGLADVLLSGGTPRTSSNVTSGQKKPALADSVSHNNLVTSLG
jgi:hypothetical protein